MSEGFEGTSRRGLALLTICMGLLVALLIGAASGQAETGQKALVLQESVTGGASSKEALHATAAGFAVTVVDATTWGTMTAAQFADYQLVIVGDPTCGSLAQVVSTNAKALSDAVMARAGGNTKVGNRILIGTDPVFHFSQGGEKLINAGIDFAGVQDGATGLYLNFTCGDIDYDSNGVGDGLQKLLPLLTADASGTWSQNTSPPCGGDVSLISKAAQFAGLTSAILRGWSCSVHETFPTFPTDWSALAIATDTPTKPTCGNDVDTGAATCGEAYVLISGSGIVSTAPDLALAPLTATNPVGTKHTVTATVTKSDKTPSPGVLVSFVVTGANAGATGTCVPADCKTGADGKVAFSYTGTKAGDDTINAAITVDGSRQTATASKTWTTVTTPPSLALDPATATNPVGTKHTVTATVNDKGAALAGTLVSFAVTGANAGATGTCAPADCKSGADGKVAFTYTGAKDGTDTITASAKVGEVSLTATAAKTWTKVVETHPGTITVIKSTFHWSTATEFTFVLHGPGGDSRAILDTDGHTATPDRWTFKDLAPGTYDLTELAAHGWEFHRAECTDHATIHDATATIVLAESANVTCTFYNTPDHH